MNKTGIAVLTLAGLAVSASAQNFLVFTDRNDDTVKTLEFGSNAITTRFTDTNADSRLGSIVRLGGDYYIANGPFLPTTPNAAGVARLSNLFNSPSLGFIAQGDPYANPAGMIFDNNTNRLWLANNFFTETPNKVPGIFNVDPGTGSTNVAYQQPLPPSTPPAPDRLTGVAQDPTSNNLLAISINGGTFVDPDTSLSPPDRRFGSQLYRLAIDPVTLDATPSLIVDFSDTSVTGLAAPITFGRDIFTIPTTGEVVITDGNGAIYGITLDGAGDFQSIRTIIDGLAAERPGGAAYNPFNNTIVFSTVFDQSIWEVNLDGTGLSLLATGVAPGGFAFVPAPASVALLGLGGLAATRRRR